MPELVPRVVAAVRREYDGRDFVADHQVDAGLTLMRRVFAGRRWYRAHREHLYQWLVRSGMTHTRVTLIYALWTASMAALLLAAPAQAWLWAAAAYALGVALWWRGKRWCLVRAAQGRIA